MFLPSNITLKLGDSGDFVAELQRRLAARDHLSNDMITSFFDGATVTAVRQFQSANGINADGVAGPETLRKLNGLTSSSGDTTSSQNDDQQASGITPTNARIMQLQMEEKIMRDQEILRAELEQQAVTLQHQLQKDAPIQQIEKSQLLTETQKQLPGVEAGRDQHLSRAAERAEMITTNLQQQQQPQAFIDRPIAQTFQAPQSQAQEQKPEQDIGSHNRGPNLALGPDKSVERTPERVTERQTENLIERTKEPAKQPTLPKEQTTERAPEQSVGTPSAERAPLRVMSPSQGVAPDFNRIRAQMESRLPPHVIEEVKQVGVVMIGNGVRGGASAPNAGAPDRTPGMEEKQAAVGGGRGI